MSYTSTTDPFGQLSTLGAKYQQSIYPSYNTFPSYAEEHVFHILNSMFELTLEPKQISALQELYNSKDESNRKLAVATFQGILLNKFKEAL